MKDNKIEKERKKNKKKNKNKRSFSICVTPDIKWTIPGSR
jgi:hypothetical protein